MDSVFYAVIWVLEWVKTEKTHRNEMKRFGLYRKQRKYRRMRDCIRFKRRECEFKWLWGAALNASMVRKRNIVTVVVLYASMMMMNHGHNNNNGEYERKPVTSFTPAHAIPARRTCTCAHPTNHSSWIYCVSDLFFFLILFHFRQLFHR